MLNLPILGSFERLEKNFSHVKDALEREVICQRESSWLMERSDLFDASSQKVKSHIVDGIFARRILQAFFKRELLLCEFADFRVRNFDVGRDSALQVITRVHSNDAWLTVLTYIANKQGISRRRAD